MGYEVVIVGSGAAGLNAAVCLWESGVKNILIVTEQWGGGTSNNAGSDKQTYYKLSQDPGVRDSALEMASDICKGGAMHGDIALIEAQYSTRAFYNLVRLGVPFPQTDLGAFPGYKTDHDPRARATSTGPLTSHDMFTCLARKVEEYGIPVKDGVVVLELHTALHEGIRYVTGLSGLDTRLTGEPGHGVVTWPARNVILATGGPAGMYRDSVYPESQTGGIGLAIKAGAVAQNLAISQFGIASTRFRWNLSGSYQQVIPRYYSTQIDGSDEREFLTDAFPDKGTLYTAIFLKGYQWPFDPEKTVNFGSSLIDLLVQQEVSSGRKVYLDFLHNPAGFSFGDLSPEARGYLEMSDAVADTPIGRLRKLNQPAIDLYLKQGIDLTREPLEIAVCAQHSNGGLTGDIWWESNIKGLFPIGEVNGSHGITRPGGSALNSGQVGGLRAAEKIIRGLGKEILQESRHHPEISTRLTSLSFGNGSLTWQAARRELKDRMSDYAGPVRDPEAIGKQVAAAWALWNRMNEDHAPVPPNEWADALRTFDLCLTHVIYLESIAEYLSKSAQKDFVRNNILEISLERDGSVKKEWVAVHPIPTGELWFETVWKNYRQSSI